MGNINQYINSEQFWTIIITDFLLLITLAFIIKGKDETSTFFNVFMFICACLMLISDIMMFQFPKQRRTWAIVASILPSLLLVFTFFVIGHCTQNSESGGVSSTVLNKSSASYHWYVAALVLSFASLIFHVQLII